MTATPLATSGGSLADSKCGCGLNNIMTEASPRLRPTNFKLIQGSDFYFYHLIKDTDTGEPIDITGYTFEMQIRKAYGDTTPLIGLNETNGRIIHEDNAGGLILVHLTAATTAALSIDTSDSYTTPPSEKWVYDLEADSHLFPPGKFKTLFGSITAYAEVTR